MTPHSSAKDNAPHHILRTPAMKRQPSLQGERALA
jgi:hypothetical protein